MDKAVADFVGESPFYMEDLSGQNNSLLPGNRVLFANLESAGIRNIRISKENVRCTTLDAFLEESSRLVPTFVKIDVEGAEVSVLKGMRTTLDGDGVALMVEVTENQETAFQLLKENGFSLFSETKTTINDPKEMVGNVFCLRPDDMRIRNFGYPS